MGIKRWRKVFSEVNCLENLSDQPADWKSNEACTLCKSNSDAPESEENSAPNVLTDQISSDRASDPTGHSNAIDPAFSSVFTASCLPANPPQLSDYLDHNNNEQFTNDHFTNEPFTNGQFTNGQFTNEAFSSEAFASLLKLTTMATTPMMNTGGLIADSEPINSLGSLNSLNNLISTTESMTANQNGTNTDFPDVKTVSIRHLVCLSFGSYMSYMNRTG